MIDCNFFAPFRLLQCPMEILYDFFESSLFITNLLNFSVKFVILEKLAEKTIVRNRKTSVKNVSVYVLERAAKILQILNKGFFDTHTHMKDVDI